MMTVHEVSKISGVSIRALHHYDKIGLLPATEVNSAGYRLYDDTALARLQSILLFRELEFPLKDIKRILDDPNFDQSAALEDQIRLLELRRKQLGKLIALARETLKTGVTPMKFDAFDKTEQEKYTAEVKEKWGNTIAYQEYQQHEKGGSTGNPADLMRHFAKLGKLKHLAPTAPEAQAAIRDLQQFITDHFYTCTLEILAGLGEMYVADDRFRKNIDMAGGEGTADFVAQAIAAYCGK